MLQNTKRSVLDQKIQKAPMDHRELKMENFAQKCTGSAMQIYRVPTLVQLFA